MRSRRGVVLLLFVFVVCVGLYLVGFGDYEAGPNDNGLTQGGGEVSTPRGAGSLVPPEGDGLPKGSRSVIKGDGNAASCFVSGEVSCGGRAVSGAVVGAVSVGPNGEIADGGLLARISSGNDGRYSINVGKALVTFRLVVISERHETALSELFTCNGASIKCDFALKKGQCIYGRIVDGDGQPISGVDVVASRQAPFESIMSNYAVRKHPRQRVLFGLYQRDGGFSSTDAAGCFTIGSLKRGEYYLWLRSNEVSLKEKTLVTAGAPHRDYVALKCLSFNAEVCDSVTGDPVKGFTVYAMFEGVGGRVGKNRSVISKCINGKMQFSWRPKGEKSSNPVKLIVKSPGYAEKEVWDVPARDHFELHPNEKMPVILLDPVSVKWCSCCVKYDDGSSYCDRLVVDYREVGKTKWHRTKSKKISPGRYIVLIPGSGVALRALRLQNKFRWEKQFYWEEEFFGPVVSDFPIVLPKGSEVLFRFSRSVEIAEKNVEAELANNSGWGRGLLIQASELLEAQFRLTEMPPGKYKLVCEHPRCAFNSGWFLVREGVSSRVDIELP